MSYRVLEILEMEKSDVYVWPEGGINDPYGLTLINVREEIQVHTHTYTKRHQHTLTPRCAHTPTHTHTHTDTCCLFSQSAGLMDSQ